ncbi:hypothetical protein AXW84_22410 [Hymenobacter sp. PAMC 26628]|nr:hypothetical protein AXW84_22410 [Hymenobacter sp. PAMC 26628]
MSQRLDRDVDMQFGEQTGHEITQLLGGLAQPLAYFFFTAAPSLGGRPLRAPSARPAIPPASQASTQAWTVA